MKALLHAHFILIIFLCMEAIILALIILVRVQRYRRNSSQEHKLDNFVNQNKTTDHEQ
jgi:tellurite resistance protein TehA-like permease